MRNVQRACVALFVVLMALPVLQRPFKLFPETELHGAEEKLTPPAFSLKTWFNGEFQREYEEYFTQRIGLRGLFVKTYNQLRLGLFRVVPDGKNAGVVLGRDNWFYMQEYIDGYNKRGRASDEQLHRIVSSVKSLQDRLAARGIAYLLVIAPSKVEIYPEHVAPGYLEPGREQRKAEYDRMIPFLDQYGIHYLDGHRMFMDLKKTTPHQLYSQSGIHWNYYSASYVVRGIIERLRDQTGKNLPTIELEDVRVDRTPYGTDNDIGDLLNLWNMDALMGPQVHPVLRRVAGPDAYEPDILFVADSFVHNLTDIMDEHKLYRKRDTFFYFNRRFSYPVNIEEPLERRSLDWDVELFARDAVVVVVNEYWLPSIGFQFNRAALAALDKKDAEK